MWVWVLRVSVGVEIGSLGWMVTDMSVVYACMFWCYAWAKCLKGKNRSVVTRLRNTSLQARLNTSVIKRGGGARREVLSASGESR